MWSNDTTFDNTNNIKHIKCSDLYCDACMTKMWIGVFWDNLSLDSRFTYLINSVQSASCVPTIAYLYTHLICLPHPNCHQGCDAILPLNGLHLFHTGGTFRIGNAIKWFTPENAQPHNTSLHNNSISCYLCFMSVAKQYWPASLTQWWQLTVTGDGLTSRQICCQAAKGLKPTWHALLLLPPIKGHGMYLLWYR